MPIESYLIDPFKLRHSAAPRLQARPMNGKRVVVEAESWEWWEHGSRGGMMCRHRPGTTGTTGTTGTRPGNLLNSPHEHCGRSHLPVLCQGRVYMHVYGVHVYQLDIGYSHCEKRFDPLSSFLPFLLSFFEMRPFRESDRIRVRGESVSSEIQLRTVKGKPSCEISNTYLR